MTRASSDKQRPLAELLAYINDRARSEAAPSSPASPPDSSPDKARSHDHRTDKARPNDHRRDSAHPENRDAGQALATQDLATRLRASYPELPLIEEFKTRWIQLSANRQLEQAQEQVPENAGPLHSSRLVTRSLALMDELSPDYLHTFMAYVDALSWTEQFLAARTQAQAATRAASSRSSGRSGASAGEKPKGRKTSRRS